MEVNIESVYSQHWNVLKFCFIFWFGFEIHYGFLYFSFPLTYASTCIWWFQWLSPEYAEWKHMLLKALRLVNILRRLVAKSLLAWTNSSPLKWVILLSCNPMVSRFRSAFYSYRNLQLSIMLLTRGPVTQYCGGSILCKNPIFSLWKYSPKFKML